MGAVRKIHRGVCLSGFGFWVLHEADLGLGYVIGFIGFRVYYTGFRLYHFRAFRT